MSERRFPVQADRDRRIPRSTVPWSVAEAAYVVYSHHYGRDQSLERLAERGGFGRDELLDLLAEELPT